MQRVETKSPELTGFWWIVWLGLKLSETALYDFEIEVEYFHAPLISHKQLSNDCIIALCGSFFLS